MEDIWNRRGGGRRNGRKSKRKIESSHQYRFSSRKNTVHKTLLEAKIELFFSRRRRRGREDEPVQVFCAFYSNHTAQRRHIHNASEI